MKTKMPSRALTVLAAAAVLFSFNSGALAADKKADAHDHAAMAKPAYMPKGWMKAMMNTNIVWMPIHENPWAT